MFNIRAVALVLLSISAQAAFAGDPGVAWISGQSEVITLDQAIDMALANNLEAQIDRVGVRIAQNRLLYAWGAFDPTLSVSASRESLETPQNATNITSAAELQQVRIQQQALLAEQEIARQLAQANGLPAPVFTSPLPSNFETIAPLIFESENFRLTHQLQGKTPLGTTYSFGLDIAERDPSIRDTDQRFVVEDTSLALFQIQQPLLRDFGPAANLAEVRISRQNQKVASLTWQQSAMNAVQTVITTYYDMLYSLENVRVREEAVAADQQLVHGNQRRIDVGIMSPIDVRQAQVAVSEDQEILLTAKNQFMERQFALKRAILSEASLDDPRVFVPASVPPPVLPPLDALAWKRTAFEKRLDYKTAIHQAEIENIRLRYTRNQVLPKLDLIASYGLNGLTTSFGTATGRAFDGQARQWSVGITASIPLFNVQGRAQLAVAKGLKEQALLKIKQTELTVDVDVDTVISRIKTNLQRVETARQSRRLGEEAMKIQNKRIEQGQVSSFDVIDTLKKLYEARTREIAARAELDRSIVQLWFAAGTLFDERHIVVVEGEKRNARPPVEHTAQFRSRSSETTLRQD